MPAFIKGHRWGGQTLVRSIHFPLPSCPRLSYLTFLLQAWNVWQNYTRKSNRSEHRNSKEAPNKIWSCLNQCWCVHPASVCKVTETIAFLPTVKTGMTYVLYSSLEPQNKVGEDLSIEMFSLPGTKWPFYHDLGASLYLWQPLLSQIKHCSSAVFCSDQHQPPLFHEKLRKALAQ